jgi:hypothetical protein|tara:strand:+ start:829 stop:1053 length:225 start_codon:yes stop_codon:yes gene_type:complete
MTDYDLSKPVQVKIKDRMDILQIMMEDNVHIDRPNIVESHIQTITKFWSAMQDEDKDYVHGARYAIEEKIEWNV